MTDRWYCIKCGELVEPKYVKNDETHEDCGGKCITLEMVRDALDKYLLCLKLYS